MIRVIRGHDPPPVRVIRVIRGHDPCPVRAFRVIRGHDPCPVRAFRGYDPPPFRLPCVGGGGSFIIRSTGFSFRSRIAS